MAYNMHVALPLYMYPFPGIWQPLYDALSNNPAVTFDVIINPNNGPGGSIPDSNYISNVSRLNMYDNVNMLGYVHTTYGSRALSDIEADIDTWNSWSQYAPSNIQIGGIFVDETPSGIDYYRYMRAIYYKVKNTLTNGNLVWTNPGVAVDAQFYNIADMINAYENSYDAWANQGGNNSIPAAVRNKSTVMLHSYPAGTHTMASDVDNLVDGSYHGALLIANNQYSSFDPIWPIFCSEVGQSNFDMKC